MTKPDYRRLDIWYVRLDPTEGSEAQKRCDPASAQDARERAPRQTRPCLVLQNDTGNQYSDVTIVAPQRVRADRAVLTHQSLLCKHERLALADDWECFAFRLEPKKYPFVVIVEPSKTNGLDRVRGLNLSQMRVVDYRRFVSKLGVLETQYNSQIDRAISIELSLFSDS